MTTRDVQNLTDECHFLIGTHLAYLENTQMLLLMMKPETCFEFNFFKISVPVTFTVLGRRNVLFRLPSFYFFIYTSCFLKRLLVKINCLKGALVQIEPKHKPYYHSNLQERMTSWSLFSTSYLHEQL